MNFYYLINYNMDQNEYYNNIYENAPNNTNINRITLMEEHINKIHSIIINNLHNLKNSNIDINELIIEINKYYKHK